MKYEINRKKKFKYNHQELKNVCVIFLTNTAYELFDFLD